ncbi:hypothetical protein CYLTODRAFT_161036 [Cylindrobasidium torrendii FP15055 ss-10]|uniref:Uncharacterized protein n=1 Tax=Cylindrobasidium torrendii FP15055 ss-10 TaxID=1314674 RepID=A0A0D7BLA6_9AGAR|nr:hypothetical protein CYLTODRAFT_161036 [Cylindrobasidium torrendii FP15055 ss-10]
MEGAAQRYVKDIDLTPRRHHGYAVVLFIMGTLFPPLAVAARFGIGGDFFLNLLLTICGYIPGHGHNFYIQNIRNNKNHARTPKWAQRYGLVDTSEIRRKQKKSQWASRYNDRLPHSTLDDAPYAEGQQPTRNSVDTGSDEVRRQPSDGLWRPEDESYYANDNNSSQSGGRWHYPANFEDAEGLSSHKKSKKKKLGSKKDRWERTEDAYAVTDDQDRKKKKKKSKRKSVAESIASSHDSVYPENPEGEHYGSRRAAPAPEQGNGSASGNGNARKATSDDIFEHQF